MRQKSAESVLEAKELIERLLHFQNTEGNFPLFLHDYPTAWDFLAPLKIAPVLLCLLREFTPVLGHVLKEKIEISLQKCLSFIDKLRSEKTLPPVWEMRYQASVQGSEISFNPSQPEEWFEWIVSMEIYKKNLPFYEEKKRNGAANWIESKWNWFFQTVPYHRGLQLFLSENQIQEKGEPRPWSIEQVLAEKDGYSPRLMRDHPSQLYAGLVNGIDSDLILNRDENDFSEIPSKIPFQIFWSGKNLHSFICPKGKTVSLLETSDPGRGDLVEVEAFCDLACNIAILDPQSGKGRKGTAFCLGDWVEIEADGWKIALRFTLLEGQGEFFGHISKGNRPSQIACKGPLLYEVYDWRIGLRTLRKQTPCVIQVDVVSRHSALRANDKLSTASPIACSPLST